MSISIKIFWLFVLVTCSMGFFTRAEATGKFIALIGVLYSLQHLNKTNK